VKLSAPTFNGFLWADAANRSWLSQLPEQF
jgi:hypothetical protein